MGAIQTAQGNSIGNQIKDKILWTFCTLVSTCICLCRCVMMSHLYKVQRRYRGEACVIHAFNCIAHSPLLITNTIEEHFRVCAHSLAYFIEPNIRRFSFISIFLSIFQAKTEMLWHEAAYIDIGYNLDSDCYIVCSYSFFNFTSCWKHWSCSTLDFEQWHACWK